VPLLPPRLDPPQRKHLLDALGQENTDVGRRALAMARAEIDQLDRLGLGGAG
jgi:hypothetical protein